MRLACSLRVVELDLLLFALSLSLVLILALLLLLSQVLLVLRLIMISRRRLSWLLSMNLPRSCTSLRGWVLLILLLGILLQVLVVVGHVV
jgi:hypothetical protein